MTGQNVINAFTTKDFKFLNERKPEIKRNITERVDEKGMDAVINKLTEEVSTVMIPQSVYPGLDQVDLCKEKCAKNIRKYVEQLINLSLEDNVTDYDLKVQ